MTYKQYFLFIIKCEDKNDYKKIFKILSRHTVNKYYYITYRLSYKL